ncbi:ribonuclease H-like domain-containing protein [Crenobacter sp. SG2305]|uniref:ribonuclease H-like domain-containing protein n=1 Tax=Crenobacter oryzisoli TaxID=3056844 RepID=UPI0025AA71DC|nr:ribonuclease H-like domain-containing protein [Crenobacter sp. SG2305]MDN0083991.1 ribonuclease H-like domain-containing protein [Crenobacter sp. SG2305]
MTATLALALQTRPDVPGFRRLFGFDAGISDENVSDFALQRRRAETGGEQLPPHLHRIVTIAAVLRQADDQLVLASFAGDGGDEAAQLTALFALIEQHQPQLVTWDGNTLPVLQHRALVHGLAAPAFCRLAASETGHLDLSAALAPHSATNNVSLDELARLCGFAGRRGAHPEGLAEADALALYQLLQGFEQLRGELPQGDRQQALRALRHALAAESDARWQALLAAWPAAPASA